VPVSGARARGVHTTCAVPHTSGKATAVFHIRCRDIIRHERIFWRFFLVRVPIAVVRTTIQIFYVSCLLSPVSCLCSRKGDHLSASPPKEHASQAAASRPNATTRPSSTNTTRQASSEISPIAHTLYPSPFYSPPLRPVSSHLLPGRGRPWCPRTWRRTVGAPSPPSAPSTGGSHRPRPTQALRLRTDRDGRVHAFVGVRLRFTQPLTRL